MSEINSLLVGAGIGSLLEDMIPKTINRIKDNEKQLIKNEDLIKSIPTYPVDYSDVILYQGSEVCDTRTNRSDGCSCYRDRQCSDGSNCIRGKCETSTCKVGECVMIDDKNSVLYKENGNGVCKTGTCIFSNVSYIKDGSNTSPQSVGCNPNEICYKDNNCYVTGTKGCDYRPLKKDTQCCQYTGRNQIFTSCPDCACSSYEAPCNNAANYVDCVNKIPYKGFCMWDNSNNMCVQDNSVLRPYTTRLKSSANPRLKPIKDSLNDSSTCYYKMDLPHNTELVQKNSDAKNYYGLTDNETTTNRVYSRFEYINAGSEIIDDSTDASITNNTVSNDVMYRCDCKNKQTKQLNQKNPLSKPNLIPQIPWEQVVKDRLENNPANIRKSVTSNKVVNAPISQGYHFGLLFSPVYLDRSIDCNNITNKSVGCPCSKDEECGSYKVNPVTTYVPENNNTSVQVLKTQKQAKCIDNICSIDDYKNKEYENNTSAYYCKTYNSNMKGFESCSKCPCHKYKVPCSNYTTKEDCIGRTGNNKYHEYCMWKADENGGGTCMTKTDVPYAYNAPRPTNYIPTNRCDC